MSLVEPLAGRFGAGHHDCQRLLENSCVYATV
jgi:hypothetical protein